MHEDELVLSDVHIQVRSNKDKDCSISRFYFSDELPEVSKTKKLKAETKNWKSGFDLHNQKECENETAELFDETFSFGVHGNPDIVQIERDDDGDFEITRRKRNLDNYSVVTIAHKLETSLQNVGQQIWLASLYMADYIVVHKDDFRGKNILDLGAGVGLTSVVAALYADHVICTDIGKDILDLAQHNMDINNTRDGINFTVKELDWFDDKFFLDKEKDLPKQVSIESDVLKSDIVISADGKFLFICCEGVWFCIGQMKFMGVFWCGTFACLFKITMKAEVIYDDDITDALFRTVYVLMANSAISTWYISLEKRFVFTVSDLDVACPAYLHFRGCLNQLEGLSDDSYQFTISVMDEVDQCFHYKRTKELELWKVTVKRKKDNLT